MSMSFSGQVALVTGAANGIGRATAQAFASAGLKVVVSDVDVAGGEQTVELIRQAGGEALFVRCDVSRDAEVQALMTHVIEAYGRLDYAFNNAGIEGAIANVEDYPAETFDQVLAINVRGIFLGLKHVVPQMREQGHGSILNTASQAGVRGVPGLAGYVASKHAVVGLSQGVALEVAAAGISVNCLCPGPTETRMMEDIRVAVRAAGGDPENFLDRMPIGRFGEPAEIADVAAWALSEAPPFMTGAVLTVDGAMTTP